MWVPGDSIGVLPDSWFSCFRYSGSTLKAPMRSALFFTLLDQIQVFTTIKVEKADKGKHAGKGLMNSIFSAEQRSRHFCFHLVLTGQAGVRNYSIFTAQMIVVWRDVIQSDATKVNLANTRCRWSLKVYFCPWRYNPL